MSPDPVYLDWNATTPLHGDVIVAMERALRETWGNPSSTHAAGRKARALIEDTRERLAEICAIDPRDVLFTGGATEANNLALAHAIGLAVSRIEHPSVTRVAEQLAERGIPVEWVPVPESGRLDPEAFRAALGRLPRGSVVTLMAANHETGVIQPVHEVARVAREVGATLHIDAVQVLGKLLPSEWLAGDSFAFAAHKIRGPKGIGALAFRETARPRPVLVGGAQERGLRPGTLDPVAVAGFGAALARVAGGPVRYARLAELRDGLERAVGAVARVNGSGARLPHVSNLSFDGARGDELVAALDLRGVCVSSGSACSAGTTEPSAVIAAMLGAERAESALRVSLGDETSEAELERAKRALFQVLGLDEPSP